MVKSTCNTVWISIRQCLLLVNHNTLNNIIGNWHTSQILNHFRIIRVASHFNVDWLRRLWGVHDAKRWHIISQFISWLRWDSTKQYLFLLPYDRDILSDSGRCQKGSVIDLIRNIGNICDISWTTLDSRSILMKLTCNYITLREYWPLRLAGHSILNWKLIGSRELLYGCRLRRFITIGNSIYSSNSIYYLIASIYRTKLDYSNILSRKIRSKFGSYYLLAKESNKKPLVYDHWEKSHIYCEKYRQKWKLKDKYPFAIARRLYFSGNFGKESYRSITWKNGFLWDIFPIKMIAAKIYLKKYLNLL